MISRLCNCTRQTDRYRSETCSFKSFKKHILLIYTHISIWHYRCLTRIYFRFKLQYNAKELPADRLEKPE